MSANFWMDLRLHIRWCISILIILLISPISAIAEQITLDLSDIDARADYHRIYLRTEGQSYDYSKWAFQGAQSTMTINNLEFGVVYYFVARSYAPNMQSIDSNEVTFSLPVPEDLEPVKVWIEAEAGNMSTPMQTQSGLGDCSEDYILAPDGSGNNYDPDQPSGSAEFHFSVPVDGTYKIWGRVLSPVGNDNSFWVSLDGGPQMLWDTIRTETWKWDALSERNVADPALCQLAAGDHTLMVKHREDGAGLDKLLITNVPGYVPEGVGEKVEPPVSEPVDSDGDGITDQDEVDLYGTDPNKSDTDEDGVDDGQELAFWGDKWRSDDDSDGIINLLDPDSDNDGITDGQELEQGTNPVIPEIIAQEPVNIWIEAEDGDISAPMQFESGVGNCSGEYVMAPDGCGSNFDANQPSGSAEFQFSVPVSGTYKIWGRVLSPVGNDNSFWVSLDSGNPMLWDTIRTTTWQWDAISARNVSDPVIFQLAAGDHTLTIKHREDGAGLDKLLITNVQDYIPEGVGEQVEAPVIEPVDSDGDGITDQQEVDLYGTDPHKSDTDEDGINDGQEIEFWGDDWNSDEDRDGIINLLDADSDNDDITDGQELEQGTNPVVPEIVHHGPVKVWLETEDGDISSPMQIQSGFGDCSGDFISAPDGSGSNFNPDQPSGSAEFHFSVPVAGIYKIWGRVLSPVGNDNSFWVSLDGGPQILWDTVRTASWQWDALSERNGADPAVFQLAAGNHTLVVKHREDGAGLDKLLITDAQDYVPEGIGEHVKRWLEAEDGVHTSPMTIESGDGSCSGDYILAPDGSGSNFNPAQPSGSAEFHFSVPAPGTYKIWGRVLSPAGNDNSFWVSLDGGPQILWDTVRSASWQWDALSERNGADPAVFRLAAGNHTLVVKHREDGAGLDKLLITNELDYIPEGIGEKVRQWLEAEDGDISSPMQIQSGAGDCSGDYIMTPDGSGNSFTPDHPSGAEFHFSVQVPGIYKIWGRVLSPAGNDNSFWISMDGGKPMLWDTVRTTSWQWDVIRERNVETPAVFKLAAGNHTLVVKHREDGAGLDKLLITNVLDEIPQ